MSTRKSKGADRGQRIQDLCRTIWGNWDYDYELDIETDDYEEYQCFVKKDYGTAFGDPLTATMLCKGEEGAWSELERMLEHMAAQVQKKAATNA